MEGLSSFPCSAGGCSSMDSLVFTLSCNHLQQQSAQTNEPQCSSMGCDRMLLQMGHCSDAARWLLLVSGVQSGGGAIVLICSMTSVILWLHGLPRFLVVFCYAHLSSPC